MHCPLFFVHKFFALLRISLWRVGGDKGGVKVPAGRAVAEDFTLGTGEGLVGVAKLESSLWTSGIVQLRQGRPFWCRGLSPQARQWFNVAVVLRVLRSRVYETMGDRCWPVVHRGRGSSVSAFRVGS